MQPDLLNLPWATLLTLACGYAGYFMANIGVRRHHQTIDVTFSTLVFGLAAAGVYNYLLSQGWTATPASVASFGAAVFLGGVWGWAVRPVLYWALRSSRITENNDLPNAWDEFSATPQLNITQISVKLTDGTWLKCENAADFNSKQYGPCVLGGGGDILMYVTHQQSPSGDDFELCEGVVSEEWGAEVTYIPQTQIARVDIRLGSKFTSS